MKLHTLFFMSALMLVSIYSPLVKADKTPLAATERIMFFLSRSNPDAQETIDKYMEGAMPLAQETGMQEGPSFPINRTIMGEKKPDFFGIFRWPSEAALNKMRYDPNYVNNLMPLRSEGWQELTIIDVDSDVKFDIDRSKHYTLAIGWYGDKESYERYIEHSAKIREKIGAKLVIWDSVKYHFTNTEDQTSPNFVAMLEWPNSDGPELYIEALQQAPEVQKLVQAGTKRIEWFALGNWPEQ